MTPTTNPATKTNGAASPAPRMSLANVKRGKINKPLRAILYGVEGVGKSTFAADAPSPIFLCAEDGAAQLDVARLPAPRNWADVIEATRILATEDHEFKTLVIDSVDWLEPLAWAQVCAAQSKASIEDLGYGKGYVMALDLWRQLLRRLEHLEWSRRMSVILIAHAHIKRVDDPQTGAFDRYRMKLHDKAADLLREWVDLVLFARYEARAVVDNRTGKARGVSTDARLMHTQWTAAFDAKNRHNLPPVLPLHFNTLAEAIKRAAPADAGQLRTELEALLERLAGEALDRAIKARDDWAKDDPARLARLVDKVRAEVLLAERAADADATSNPHDSEA